MCWEQRRVPGSWKEGVIRLIPKQAAEEDPPALTSCVGKLFTSMLRGRWLRFMTGNSYLDTLLQKAFLPGVPGCIEHYHKLSAITADAHKKHRSLTVCWLDLANAYGSVHHQLITHCLKRYHAPQSFIDTISNVYANLSATITTKEWSTP
jgi:hypothetical protein